jgi:hypothetical protein
MGCRRAQPPHDDWSYRSSCFSRFRRRSLRGGPTLPKGRTPLPGRRYLVGTPKSELRKWAAAIADARDWHTARDKERAMHERFARRIEERLTRLGRRVQQARRPLDMRKLERQVGRLLEQNQRAAARYVIEFVPDATRPAGIGGRTSSSPTPRRRFVFTRASWGFVRCGTSVPTACRPTSSCASPRTCCGGRSSSGSGAPGSARARARSSTNSNAFRAPTSCCRRRSGVSSRLRCVVRPDAAQAALLDRLGLELPARLRIRSPAVERASVPTFSLTPSNCGSWASGRRSSRSPARSPGSSGPLPRR